MLFSQRNNYKPASKEIQRESLDQGTRNLLWNAFSSFCHKIHLNPAHLYYEFLQNIWGNFFKENIDQVPIIRGCSYRHERYYEYFRQQFCDNLPWFECFDFIEFVIEASSQIDSFRQSIPPFCNKINKVLEQESTAYRLIQGKITEITSPVEIEAIENAISTGQGAESIHLQRALELLSDRKNPDYNNSAKESISAVEAICCKITGDSKAMLNQALDHVEQKYPLHGAVKKAFSALYGYASDAQGIRHGGIDFTTVDYPLAKYMLVACSAFVNYLRELQK